MADLKMNIAAVNIAKILVDAAAQGITGITGTTIEINLIRKDIRSKVLLINKPWHGFK